MQDGIALDPSLALSGFALVPVQDGIPLDPSLALVAAGGSGTDVASGLVAEKVLCSSLNGAVPLFLTPLPNRKVLATAPPDDV